VANDHVLETDETVPISSTVNNVISVMIVWSRGGWETERLFGFEPSII